MRSKKTMPFSDHDFQLNDFERFRSHIVSDPTSMPAQCHIWYSKTTQKSFSFSLTQSKAICAFGLCKLSICCEIIFDRCECGAHIQMNYWFFYVPPKDTFDWEIEWVARKCLYTNSKNNLKITNFFFWFNHNVSEAIKNKPLQFEVLRRLRLYSHKCCDMQLQHIRLKIAKQSILKGNSKIVVIEQYCWNGHKPFRIKPVTTKI